MCNLRLTTAQALVRYLSHQFVEIDGTTVPFIAGAWAIFGHGNVAGLGEALHAARDVLPTFRAHNEQGMALAAIAYAKQMRRQRAMICTTSIGPGATNMVTAAALAHIDRLPVLLLPGDVFANRRPDPVLQQVEDFGDGLITANDCFRPVSRYFDRIMRPEQLLKALPQAMAILTDPAECGPVTLGLCQDVQAEAYDFPEAFFAPRTWRIRAPQADARDLADLTAALKAARRPLVIVGGGVKYSGAVEALAAFSRQCDVPFAETQAGKGAIAWDHPNNLGGIGVTGTRAANDAAQEADLVIGVGTRLQDFTTGSAALFAPAARMMQINVNSLDAAKFGALAVTGDAGIVLADLTQHLGNWRAPSDWLAKMRKGKAEWNAVVDNTYAAVSVPPTDAQVLGALERSLAADTVIVCAAGGLPGELHKLWRVTEPGGYHLEYGYSCMGYEIPGALGVKMAAPERDVCAVIGDGGYLMMNSELASAVMLGVKLIVVLLDNGGFGCIDRLQRSVGNASFNNLFRDCHAAVMPGIDFAAHACALGAQSETVTTAAELEAAIGRARAAATTSLIVIRTNPEITTREGGAWWDVAPPETTEHGNQARQAYDAKLATIKKGN